MDVHNVISGEPELSGTCSKTLHCSGAATWLGVGQSADGQEVPQDPLVAKGSALVTPSLDASPAGL